MTSIEQDNSLATTSILSETPIAPASRRNEITALNIIAEAQDLPQARVDAYQSLNDALFMHTRVVGDPRVAPSDLEALPGIVYQRATNLATQIFSASAYREYAKNEQVNGRKPNRRQPASEQDALIFGSVHALLEKDGHPDAQQLLSIIILAIDDISSYDPTTASLLEDAYDRSLGPNINDEVHHAGFVTQYIHKKAALLEKGDSEATSVDERPVSQALGALTLSQQSTGNSKDSENDTTMANIPLSVEESARLSSKAVTEMQQGNFAAVNQILETMTDDGTRAKTLVMIIEETKKTGDRVTHEIVNDALLSAMSAYETEPSTMHAEILFSAAEYVINSDLPEDDYQRLIDLAHKAEKILENPESSIRTGFF